MSSATLRVLLNGALKTGIPRPCASARSTWFVPMQKQPRVRRSFPAASTRGVTCVLLRIPSTWTPAIRSSSSASFGECAMDSTSKPELCKSSRAVGWTFSTRSTFTRSGDCVMTGGL